MPLPPLPAALLAAALLLLPAACAPAVERVYAAPSRENVFSGSEASMDGRGAHLWVENRSTVPITVTSVRLYDCENIKNRCEVTRLNVAVHPGRRVRIATVQAANDTAAYRYRWSWTWSHEGSPEIPGFPR